MIPGTRPRTKEEYLELTLSREAEEHNKKMRRERLKINLVWLPAYAVGVLFAYYFFVFVLLRAETPLELGEGMAGTFVYSIMAREIGLKGTQKRRPTKWEAWQQVKGALAIGLILGYLWVVLTMLFDYSVWHFLLVTWFWVLIAWKEYRGFSERTRRMML